MYAFQFGGSPFVLIESDPCFQNHRITELALLAEK